MARLSCNNHSYPLVLSPRARILISPRCMPMSMNCIRLVRELTAQLADNDAKLAATRAEVDQLRLIVLRLQRTRFEVGLGDGVTDFDRLLSESRFCATATCRDRHYQPGGRDTVICRCTSSSVGIHASLRSRVFGWSWCDPRPSTKGLFPILARSVAVFVSLMR